MIVFITDLTYVCKYDYILNTIVQYNGVQLERVEGDQTHAKNLITLFDENEGVSVWNPFFDTTLIYEVNPIKEYGKDNIVRFIKDYFEKVVKQ